MMNLPDILNVAIGLVLIFFLLSSIASLLLEIITSAARYREEILYVSINRLLTGEEDQPWNIQQLVLSRIAGRLPEGSGPFGLWSVLRRRWAEPAVPQATGAESENAQKKSIVERFWQHPKIRSLATAGADAPASIEPATFAQVLVDVAVPRDAQGQLPDNRLSLDRALAAPSEKTPSCLLKTLRSLALSGEISPGASGDNLWPPFRSNVASWFNEAGVQATNFYKRSMQKLLLGTGLVLALACNADALRVFYVLAHNHTLAETTTAFAATLTAEKAAVAQPGTSETSKQSAAVNAVQTGKLSRLRQDLGDDIQRLRALEQIGFPIGWAAPDGGFHYGDAWLTWAGAHSAGANVWPLVAAIVALLALKFLGVGLTALATAQGAPFWYDLMQRMVSLRKGAASAKEETKKEPLIGATPAANTSLNGKVAIPTPLPLEIGSDLAAPATGFSARKAYWLACSSAAAYSPRREIEALVKQTWHFHRFEFFDEKGTQGFLAADEKIVLIAFRGTELGELHDLIADTDIFLTPFGNGDPRKVHRGFLEALDKVWTSLEQQVAAFLNPEDGKPPRQIFLTGHSLGGALATLMFARLMAKGQRPIPTLYTFGCPRVGDSAFTQDLDRRYPERIHRIVNDLDAVPNVPPFETYHHAGRLLAFDPKGPGGVRTEVSGLSRFLGYAANAAAKGLKEAGRDALDAHGISHYVAGCERLANTG